MKMSEIKARCEAATPGPWQLGNIHWHKGCGGRDCKQSVHGPHGIAVAVCFRAQYRATWNEKPPYTQHDSDDAVFIAHAITDIPNLLYRIEELEKALKELIDQFLDHSGVFIPELGMDIGMLFGVGKAIEVLEGGKV